MFDISRHSSVFDPHKFLFPVHIIGCGGMGSRVAEALVRMGVGIPEKNPVWLYDKDVFEKHNLANQWFVPKYLKQKKVLAVREMMLEINPEASVTAVGRYIAQKEYSFSGIVFICVDSMQARRFIVDHLLIHNKNVQCVIETRMDAGVGISHCFNPNNPKHLDCWRMYWFSDKEAENMQGCSSPQSIISAIYGTTSVALKQFERFAKTGSTLNSANRVYCDFESHQMRSEVWQLD